jgi:hypothetical protein
VALDEACKLKDVFGNQFGLKKTKLKAWKSK